MNVCVWGGATTRQRSIDQRHHVDGDLLAAFATRILPVDLAVVRPACAMHAPDPRPERDVPKAATALNLSLVVVTATSLTSSRWAWSYSTRGTSGRTRHHRSERPGRIRDGWLTGEVDLSGGLALPLPFPVRSAGSSALLALYLQPSVSSSTPTTLLSTSTRLRRGPRSPAPGRRDQDRVRRAATSATVGGRAGGRCLLPVG